MRIAVAGGTGIVGRYTVEAAASAGHDVVVLARSAGVDTITGSGLVEALQGVDAIVDATNSGTTEEAPATEFFTVSTANLQRVGAEQGVGHLVVLSIVGIDRAPTGYYAAKIAHERAALSGPVAATIQRATQFHEFPGQMIGWNRDGNVAPIPDWRVQPVAARTVGAVLARLAGGTPQERVADLAGPSQEDLPELARRLVNQYNLGIEIQPVAGGLAPTTLVAGDNAHIEGPSFDAWLTGGDAEPLLAMLL